LPTVARSGAERMGFDSFRILVKKTLHEHRYGPLPGDPDSPTSSQFVATALEKVGFVYDYHFHPADDNTGFPTISVYTTTHRDLPIERAIQIIRDSKPRRVRNQHGIITARYRREPADPSNPDHYRFFFDPVC
jgi:hypothetical protein